MIVAATLCPAAPLLARELTGADPVVPGLRKACRDAVAILVQSRPDVIAVLAPGERTGTWDADAGRDLSWYAPGLRADPGGREPGRPGLALPLPLSLGMRMLDEVGYVGARVLQSVGDYEPAARCVMLGAALVAAAPRVALLTMADGSARRGDRAPGYRDERAGAFDAAVEGAVRGGQLHRLLGIDEVLARELMAAGRPAWQVMAGAFDGVAVSGRVHYSDDPFGVAYLVASLAPA
jgi:hypothetical protein